MFDFLSPACSTFWWQSQTIILIWVTWWRCMLPFDIIIILWQKMADDNDVVLALATTIIVMAAARMHRWHKRSCWVHDRMLCRQLYGTYWSSGNRYLTHWSETYQNFCQMDTAEYDTTTILNNYHHTSIKTLKKLLDSSFFKDTRQKNSMTEVGMYRISGSGSC